MAAILSLGSINADFQLRVDRWPPDDGLVPGRDLLCASGGKAANVAVFARRLDTYARLFGCVGDDDLVQQALRGPRAAGVDLTGVRYTRGPTGLATIVVAPGGDKTIILVGNANEAWAHHADQVRREVAAATTPGSVLVVDLEVPVPVVQAAVRAVRGRGVVLLDPSPADRVADDLLSEVDHVTPNHREARRLTGIDAGPPDGALAAAEALQAKGAGAAYVKLRSGGCAVAAEGVRTLIPAPAELPVVDKTGAGDAFAGGLAWALLSGEPPAEAAVVAVAAASCAVTRYGSQASYPTAGELAEMTTRVRQAVRGQKVS